MTAPGAALLPEGGRVDVDRLRAARRRRLLEAIVAGGVDALALGRPANVFFASGARQLWTAGARPFSPTAVVVAATGRLHLLSTWDEGVPAEIPHEDLFGLTWNPAVLAACLARIPGLSGRFRLATDGWNPAAAQLLASVWPQAEVVDGEPILRDARSVKNPDEVACIMTAAALAEAAMSDLVGALRPGVTVPQLLGTYAAALAGRGSPTPPSESVVHLSGGPVVGPGELVAFSPGALWLGYEGTLARTWVAGGRAPTPEQERLGEEASAALTRAVARCQPGATGADLLGAGAAQVRGVGLGAEPPVILPGVGASAVLAAGTVLAVRIDARSDAGRVLLEDLVFVSDGGPRVLTRYSSPLGGA